MKETIITPEAKELLLSQEFKTPNNTYSFYNSPTGDGELYFGGYRYIRGRSLFIAKVIKIKGYWDKNILTMKVYSRETYFGGEITYSIPDEEIEAWKTAFPGLDSEVSVAEPFL